MARAYSLSKALDILKLSGISVSEVIFNNDGSFRILTQNKPDDLDDAFQQARMARRVSKSSKAQ
jgi:hypothetical protein